MAWQASRGVEPVEGNTSSSEKRRREGEARLAGMFFFGVVTVLCAFFAAGILLRLSLQRALGYLVHAEAAAYVILGFFILCCFFCRGARRSPFFRVPTGLAAVFCMALSTLAVCAAAVTVYPSLTGVSPSTYSLVANISGLVETDGAVYVSSATAYTGGVAMMDKKTGMWRFQQTGRPTTALAGCPDYAAAFQPSPSAPGSGVAHARLLVFGPDGELLHTVELPACDGWRAPSRFVASELGVVAERDGVAVAWDRDSGLVAAYQPDEWPDEVHQQLSVPESDQSVSVGEETWRRAAGAIEVLDASGEPVARLVPKRFGIRNLFWAPIRHKRSPVRRIPVG